MARKISPREMRPDDTTARVSVRVITRTSRDKIASRFHADRDILSNGRRQAKYDFRREGGSGWMQVWGVGDEAAERNYSDRLGFGRLRLTRFALVPLTGGRRAACGRGGPRPRYTLRTDATARLAHSAGRAGETEEAVEKLVREGRRGTIAGLYPGQFYRNVSMLAREYAHARVGVRDTVCVSIRSNRAD